MKQIVDSFFSHELGKSGPFVTKKPQFFRAHMKKWVD